MLATPEPFTLPPSFRDWSRFHPIVDVRSPSEFNEDHLPNSINLPVLSDQERAEVGALYKKEPFAGRAQGAALITANIARHLPTLINEWPRDARPLLYCWRGGLRSQSFSQILCSIGWRTTFLSEGYKSYRKEAIAQLKELSIHLSPRFQVLTGLTGVGKTRLLKALANLQKETIDLEELANHRGSLLGNRGTQPHQKAFESRLLCTLQSIPLEDNTPIFIEAESNKIGNCHLPPGFWKALREAKVTQINLPLAKRSQLLREDYAHFLSQPDLLIPLLDRLRPLRGHQQVNTWQEQIRTSDWDNFLNSILRDHYDLAYRPAGSEQSNYQAPSHEVHLTEISSEELNKAAGALLTHRNP